MFKREYLITFALLLAVAMLAAGCGGAAPATAVPATSAPAATDTSAPTAAPATSAPAATDTTAPTTAAATGAATTEVARPSNGNLTGGPALNLTGDPANGAVVYATNCKKCHGDQGKGGVANPGSDDGTVPPLNPIDETIKGSDPKTFAYNMDLFIEHGSTPSGSNPTLVMDAWGDKSKISAQQIADVMAYIISLNQ